MGQRGTPLWLLRRVLHDLDRLSHLVLSRDVVLVTLMAFTAALSSVAIHQATLSTDRAADQLEESRAFAAEAARQEDYVGTLIDHDLRMLGPFCTAVLSRQDSYMSLLQDDSAVAQVREADTQIDSLRALLQGDRTATCSLAAAGAGDAGQDADRYSLIRARQVASDYYGEPAANRSSALDAALLARDLSRGETWLMGSGVLFAAALAALVVIEALNSHGGRPQRLPAARVPTVQKAMLALSAVLWSAGLVILLTNIDAWGYPVALTVLALLWCGLHWLWVWTTGPHDDRSQGAQGRAQWWAEVASAISLVAFAVSAAGLSYVTIAEREANATASNRAIAAQELQQNGQQAALRDLTTAAQAALLDVQGGTVSPLLDGSDKSTRSSGLADQLVAQLGELERSVADQRSRTAEDSLSRGDCRDQVDPATGPRPDPLLGERLTAEAVDAHIRSAQEPFRVCDAAASLARDEARRWAEHGSTFAVSLVVLGLASFLLALAADQDRTPRSARVLLRVGAAGTTAGVALGLVAVPDIGWRASIPDDYTVVGFSRAVAAAYEDPCASGDDLERAVEQYRDYGPAYEALADQFRCSEAGTDGVITSTGHSAGTTEQVVRLLERAVRLGPATPRLVLELGEWHVRHELVAGEPVVPVWQALPAGGWSDGPLAYVEGSSLVSRLRPDGLSPGLTAATTAVRTLERQKDAGPLLHEARFTVGLAHAASGDRAAAVRAYREAIACLSPDRRCPGDGVRDDALVDELVVNALADVELLDESIARTLRRVLLSEYVVGTATLSGAVEWELLVFPQELQLTSVGDGYVTSPSVVALWYHQAPGEDTWGVLRSPTLQTLRPGQHLNYPLDAGVGLERGRYRVDVYSDRSMQSWETTYSDDVRDVSVRSPQLSLRAVVPSDWYVEEETSTTWRVGNSLEEALVVERQEGVDADAEGTRAWLDARLDEWLSINAPGTWAASSNGYFLGLQQAVVRYNEETGSFAGAGLAPYGGGMACGSTLVLAAVQASSTGGNFNFNPIKVWNSVLLDSTPRIPVHDGDVRAGPLQMTVPDGWDAVTQSERPTGRIVSMRDCREGEASITVDLDTKASIRAPLAAARWLPTAKATLPGFELTSRRDRTVAGAASAHEVRYSWLGDEGSAPSRGAVLFVSSGSLLVRMTLSASEDEYPGRAATFDATVTSMQLQEQAPAGRRPG